MQASSEKSVTLANLQLNHHGPLFVCVSLTLLIMGSMRKATFPFLTLCIVHQKPVFLSARVQTMSKWREKKKKKPRKTITGAVCPSFHCVNREGVRLCILQGIGWHQTSSSNWYLDTSVKGVIVGGNF